MQEPIGRVVTEPLGLDSGVKIWMVPSQDEEANSDLFIRFQEREKTSR